MVVGRGLEQRYGSPTGAAAYRTKYEGSWARRLSARREAALLRWALGQAGTEGVALDAPCGAGRMTPVLLERARRVTAVDLSPAMVDVARAALAGPIADGRVVLSTGSVDALAYDDGAFDTSVCWRLLHHVTDRATRVRILAGLARVSRRAVVVTFADAGTWKARLQRVRGRDRRCVKWTPDDLRDEVREARLEVVATRRLASMFSLLSVAVLRPPAPPGEPGGARTGRPAGSA